MSQTVVRSETPRHCIRHMRVPMGVWEPAAHRHSPRAADSPARPLRAGLPRDIRLPASAAAATETAAAAARTVAAGPRAALRAREVFRPLRAVVPRPAIAIELIDRAPV